MTIDTSREAVERVRAYIERRRKDRGADQEVVHGYDVGHSARPDGYMLNVSDIAALLAERDTALAEVARLSSPPDDAEVEAAHREWFATTYPHTYADVQSDYEALDAFVTSEEAWAAATRATLAKHGGK